MTTTIGVAICTKDRPQSLYRLLKSLIKYHNKPDSYTIIDDISNSSLVSVKKISKILSPVKIKYFPVKYKSISRSRNLALKTCTDKFLVFFDDDTEVKSNIINRTKYNYEHHPNICAFTPTILPTDNKKLSFVFSCLMNNKHIYNRSYTPRIIGTGTCFSINLKMTKTHQIHFPSYALHTYEDIIFFLRLNQKHLTTYHDPSMIVYHHYNLRNSLKTYYRFFKYDQNLYQVLKHYSFLFPDKINWIFPGRLLDFIFYPFFFIKTAGRRTTAFLEDTQIPIKYYFQSFLMFFFLTLGAHSRFPFLKEFIRRIKLFHSFH